MKNKHTSRRFIYSLIALLLLVIPGMAAANNLVEIVIHSKATPPEKIAARELETYLSKIYAQNRFKTNETVSGKAGYTIHLGTPATLPPSLIKHGGKKLTHPESYVVTTAGNSTGIIIGSDPLGVTYGVYGLLEKLGCGFYLTEENIPSSQNPFSLEDWQLHNKPLQKKRYVFNWHNFLSGCTSWDEKHWFQWIDRTRRMGYNQIMLHAYFNSPLHTYSYQGLEKSSGYISTSALGRDWGNIPVNDVRRLPGGDIFSQPEFGSESALVPHQKRIEEAQAMMLRVFEYAKERGVKTTFAFDIDKSIEYLQKDLIAQVPEKGKFLTCRGKIWIPNPDTDEGLAFYTAQIKGLLKSYPMLNEIASWRRGGSFFKKVKLDELPTLWQKEYNQCLTDNAVLKDQSKGELMAAFITAKLTKGYMKSLKALGHPNIKVPTGTWRHHFIVPTAIFLPETELMPIDWNVRFNKSLLMGESIMKNIEKYAKGRVTPFIWSHHDDGEYIGRCYIPADKLQSKLSQIQSMGCGVFHWLNRPQDLFFKNVQRQIWNNSVNETYKTTCQQMALDFFGDKKLGSYLIDWVEQAPIFGRATQPNMHYRAWKECTFDDSAITNGKQRLAVLNAIDVSKMNSEQINRLTYFKLLEQFILEFIDAQRHLDKAEEYLKKGNVKMAAEVLRRGSPERAVKTYAKMSNTGNIDRGEKAYVVSLATKWIGDYDSFRQRVRILPIGVKLGETVPESIAQKNVNITYYIDQNHKFWEKLGNEILLPPSSKETSHKEDSLNKKKKRKNRNIPYNLEENSMLNVVKRTANGKENYTEEIFLEGLKIGRAIIPIRPIMRAHNVPNSSHLSKGNYILKLYASSQNSEKGSEMMVTVNGVNKLHKIKGDSIVEMQVKLSKTSKLEVVCESRSNDVILSALLLVPEKSE